MLINLVNFYYQLCSIQAGHTRHLVKFKVHVVTKRERDLKVQETSPSTHIKNSTFTYKPKENLPSSSEPRGLTDKVRVPETFHLYKKLKSSFNYSIVAHTL